MVSQEDQELQASLEEQDSPVNLVNQVVQD